MNRGNRGFTLIEALAAVVLIATGITATIQCLGGMARSRAKAFEREEMERLAYRKYDEILAIGSLTSGSDQGEFQEDPKYAWRAQRSPIGEGSLDLLRVEVGYRGQGFIQKREVQGLVCRDKEASQ